jgi:hypothetical protein
VPDAPQPYTVRLTQAQRKVIAEIVPELADRMKLDEKPIGDCDDRDARVQALPQ